MDALAGDANRACLGVGNELERLSVARAHRREVAMVESCHLALFESLDQSQDRGVDDPHSELGVGGLELVAALQIASAGVRQLIGALEQVVRKPSQTSLERRFWHQ